MPFRCKQAFPREEKCLLDLLRSVLQSFKEAWERKRKEVYYKTWGMPWEEAE
jgi:hypothetical protein